MAAYQTEDFNESLGVNDRVALAQANQLMRERINLNHMLNGVTLIDPATTYIDAAVEIGSDTVIEGNVVIKGATKIGEDCFITNGSQIVDSLLADRVVIKASVVEKSRLHSGVDVGPYAHLRPNAEICADAHIGNYVEIKNAKIGENTKVGHLTYVGDATLGKDINVGCGVVFVNYDGKSKYRTTVGDRSFIGSNANLVAPLTIEDHTFIAAGSTITKDIPEFAMGIARAKQINKEEFAKKLPYFQ